MSVYHLVGAGGTGSYLFPPLVRYLENYHGHREEDWALYVIDGDEVSPSNLTRQAFFGRYVAENKARALTDQYGSDPSTIIPLAAYLGTENIDGIGDGDTVLIAVDNFPVRSHIENHCKTLNNVTVINGGNEEYDGTIQIWLRRGGENITEPLSTNHPEIHRPGDDRAEMTCEAIAELEGGGQTLIANLTSATLMLNALMATHRYDENGTEILKDEIFFDTRTFAMRGEKRKPVPA